MDNVVHKSIDEISDKPFLNKKRKREISKNNKKIKKDIDKNNNDNNEEKKIATNDKKNNDNKEEKINLISTNDKKNEKVNKIKLIKNLAKNCDTNGYYSTFIVFKSIDDILYLIYSSGTSIISLNLLDFKIINEIKNAYTCNISYFNYIFDELNKRDLILTVSRLNVNIKLWNVNNWQCLCDYNRLRINGIIWNPCFLLSTCFLKDNNQYFIIISKLIFGDEPELIKVYDLKGEKIKEINDSKEKFILYIFNYYDNIFNKNYIITLNDFNIQSYDYNENKKYHKYSQDIYIQYKFFKIKIEEIIKLIVSGENYIEIWNFHSGEFLNKINFPYYFSGSFLFLNNDEYILYGCQNPKYLALSELKTGKTIQLSSHDCIIATLEKINHPFYGECIISQGLFNDNIYLWQVID